MKTIELKRSESGKMLFSLVDTDERSRSITAHLCDIEDDNLILIGKRDFEKLLANQKAREDLPTNTPVMIRNCAYWALGQYKGKGKADDAAFTQTTARTYWLTFDHIIPYSFFDPDNPDKWNGTENDYGTEGGAR